MKELDVELINEADGKYECALVDEEGNKKHKFVIELSNEDLQDMTEDIIFRKKITKDALYRDLKEVIAQLIIEKCEKFSESINYEDLYRYDSMAAGDIAASLSGWIEQRVYDYLDSIYKLDNEQLEEMKKFYHERIDLNLVIKRSDTNSVLGSELLSADEMKKIRISKENELLKMRNNNGFNNFKESFKIDDVSMPKEVQKENGENINNLTDLDR